jgi:Mrp family chromosome partitioning ATPase
MSKNFELLQRVAKDDVFSFPAVAAPIPEKSPIAVPIRKDPQDSEIAKLVQRLFSQTIKSSAPRVVTFSGMSRDDRSCWICARVGETLVAHADASVCMVDANFFSPQLHQQFNAPNRIGLADALSTQSPIRNFATPLSTGNLWMIPAGLAKPGFCASVERYRERFAELRKEFDYVVVTAPDLTRETEATRIAQMTDGIVMIVEANHSRRDTVRRAKEQLESARIKLLGAVLDQRTFPIPEKLYRRL